jgi:Lrp/AsnC family leucine-responsive transcriptional regulator
METEETLAIDEIDRRIIGILASQGRLSFRDLGAQVHLSPNATAERVRRLQSAGVIRAFRAEIDHARLGLSFEAYIDVRLQRGTSAQQFEAVAMKLPGVMSAAILTGALDFRLRVACKGPSDLVQLIENLRSRAGVQETNTAMILRELTGNMRLAKLQIREMGLREAKKTD